MMSFVAEKARESAKKQNTEHYDGDEDKEPIYSILPIKTDPLVYGVGYENLFFSSVFYCNNLQKRLTNDVVMEGEYDLIYVCFNTFLPFLCVQEGFCEEFLNLHRSVQGSLVLKRKDDGKLCGSVKYEGAKGSMIPSNGFFSFVEEKRKKDKIEYSVTEQFCWEDVGTNTAPVGCIQVVGHAGALGLQSDTLSYESKLRWNGQYDLSLDFDNDNVTRKRSREKAKELMYAYNNVTASWLCTRLQFPPEIAQLIRSFQDGCKIGLLLGCVPSCNSLPR
jgi:hypothetical protein